MRDRPVVYRRAKAMFDAQLKLLSTLTFFINLAGSLAHAVSQGSVRAPIAVGVMLTNTLATAVWTVGVFAALYAGYLAPEFRATASQLSGVINGGATILLFAVVDPFLAMLTDDVVSGGSTEATFRRAVVWMLGSRLAGTVLAQALLLPASHVIAKLARMI